MTSYTVVNGGGVVQTANPSYISIGLDANKTLAWPTQFQNTNNVVAAIVDVAPDQNGRTLTMPDATLTSVGQQVYMNNPTAFSFTLNKADNTLLTTVNATSVIFFYLTDNTTIGGTWRASTFGGGATHVTSVGAVSNNGNLTIAGSPITVAGTFTFGLAGNLLSLSGLIPTGITALTDDLDDPFKLVTITGSANQIVVVNGDGVGNPTLSLDPNITGLTSLGVGDLSLAGNSITATNANGSISLIPFGGTGSVRIYNNPVSNFYNSFVSSAALAANISLQLPTTAPTAGQVLTATSAASPYPLGWADVPSIIGGSTLDAIPRFANVGGGLKDSFVFIDDNDNISLGALISPDGAVNSIILGDSQQLRLGVLDSQTISTSSGSLRLQPVVSETVKIGSPDIANSVEIFGGEGIYFQNTAENQVVGLFADTATNTYNLSLPVSNGVINSIVYSTDGAGQLGFTTAPITISGISRARGLVSSGGGISGGDNIASVTSPGTGIYEVTLTVPFSTSTYIVTPCADNSGDRITTTYSITSSSVFRIYTWDSAGVAVDNAFAFTCFGS